jgi:hypothetical protein
MRRLMAGRGPLLRAARGGRARRRSRLRSTASGLLLCPALLRARRVLKLLLQPILLLLLLLHMTPRRSLSSSSLSSLSTTTVDEAAAGQQLRCATRVRRLLVPLWLLLLLVVVLLLLLLLGRLLGRLRRASRARGPRRHRALLQQQRHDGIVGAVGAAAWRWRRCWRALLPCCAMRCPLCRLRP